jgi:hypothetical protein
MVGSEKQRRELMPKVSQPITLSAAEKTELNMIVNQGRHPARMIKRAQILLYSHAGKKPKRSSSGWMSVGRRSIMCGSVTLRQGWRQP